MGLTHFEVGDIVGPSDEYRKKCSTWAASNNPVMEMDRRGPLIVERIVRQGEDAYGDMIYISGFGGNWWGAVCLKLIDRPRDHITNKNHNGTADGKGHDRGGGLRGGG